MILKEIKNKKTILKRINNTILYGAIMSNYKGYEYSNSFLNILNPFQFTVKDHLEFKYVEDKIVGLSANEIIILKEDNTNFELINNDNNLREKFVYHDKQRKITFEYKFGLRYYINNELEDETKDEACGALYSDSKYFCFYASVKDSMFEMSKLSIRSFDDFSKLIEIDLSSYTSYEDFTEPGVSKNGKIVDTLGIYNNTLWLTTTNHNLFGIDVKTGEILHHFRDIPKLKNVDYGYTYIPFAGRGKARLFADQGVIIGLTLSMSWQLDLLSKEFTFVDLRSQLGRSATMTNVLSIDIEEAWFTSEPERDELRVGHLNRRSNKITTWKCKDLDPSMGLVFNIVRKDEMVYMLDQGKRLYAFELEEGELSMVT
jgi:hypothetical protein